MSMKNVKISSTTVGTLMMLVFFVGMSMVSVAQNKPEANDDDDVYGHGGKRGERMMAKLGLNAEQKTQMEKLRTAHLKEVLPIKNQLDIKRAELKALETADKADLNAINKKIDELSALRTEIRKKKAAHRQDIRKMLTDEQRIKFDMAAGHERRGFKQGGNGMGNGQGERRRGGRQDNRQ